MTDEISVEVVVDDAGAAGRGRHTVLRLAWRRVDPLAVLLRLTAQPDHPALPRGEWVCLRDFLRYGLEEPTGDGDVRISPDPARDRVVLLLTRGGRSHTVSASCLVVRRFLDDTEAVVPAGEERSDLALDALIERLLAT